MVIYYLSSIDLMIYDIQNMTTTHDS